MCSNEDEKIFLPWRNEPMYGLEVEVQSHNIEIFEEMLNETFGSDIITMADYDGDGFEFVIRPLTYIDAKFILDFASKLEGENDSNGTHINVQMPREHMIDFVKDVTAKALSNTDYYIGRLKAYGWTLAEDRADAFVSINDVFITAERRWYRIGKNLDNDCALVEIRLPHNNVATNLLTAMNDIIIDSYNFPYLYAANKIPNDVIVVNKNIFSEINKIRIREGMISHKIYSWEVEGMRRIAVPASYFIGTELERILNDDENCTNPRIARMQIIENHRDEIDAIYTKEIK